MTRIGGVYVAIGENRRAAQWESQRVRALQIHANDPELPLADIARRLGVRRKSVSDWVNEETRAHGKG